MSYNFKLVNYDTDSITISKQDGAEFSKEEKERLIKELNSLFPEKISWEDDGEYDTILVIKAKNYALYDGKKIKIKGSALKSATKSEALKEFMKRAIDILIHDRDFEIAVQNLQGLYMNYVHEILDIKNIKRWSARKTYSSTMEESERSNETKLMDAIEGSEYREGDRFHVFYLPDDTISLAENFNGIYNKKRLFKNLFDSMMIFETVIPDAEKLFLNYSLKRNEKYLPGYVDPIKPPKVTKPRKKKATDDTTQNSST